MAGLLRQVPGNSTPVFPMVRQRIAVKSGHCDFLNTLAWVSVQLVLRQTTNNRRISLVAGQVWLIAAYFRANRRDEMAARPRSVRRKSLAI